MINLKNSVINDWFSSWYYNTSVSSDCSLIDDYVNWDDTSFFVN